MKSGHMQPPSALPAKVAPAAAASVRPSPQIRVRTTEPRSPTNWSTACVTFTGTAIRGSSTTSLTSDTIDRSTCSGSSTRPVSSTTVANSPSGSITKPRSLPDTRTSSATRATLAVCVSTNSDADAVLANGFTASTSAPNDVRRLGITIETAPNE